MDEVTGPEGRGAKKPRVKMKFGVQSQQVVRHRGAPGPRMQIQISSETTPWPRYEGIEEMQSKKL